MGVRLSAPEPLTAAHDVATFSCGQPTLDEWLKRRALNNQKTGASRTYVVTDGARVVAYYALASGALASSGATGKVRRNMPDPIPVVVLGRLAVDRSLHGRGIGRALMRDAGQRIVHAADVIGIRGVVVHALSEQAKDFYMRLGFTASPLDPMLLMVTLADLRAACA